MVARIAARLAVVALAPLVALSGCENHDRRTYEVNAPLVADEHGPRALAPSGDSAGLVGGTTERTIRVAAQLGICVEPSSQDWTAEVRTSDDVVLVTMIPPAALLREPPLCAGSIMQSLHSVRLREAVGGRTVEASIQR